MNKINRYTCDGQGMKGCSGDLVVGIFNCGGSITVGRGKFGYRGGIREGGGVGDGGGVFGNRGSVRDRGGVFGDGGGHDGLDADGLPADDGVETVVGISGVLHGSLQAVSVHQGVAALDDVSVAALLLALAVAGEAVLDVVGEGVLGVGVVVVGYDGLGDCQRGRIFGDGGRVRDGGWGQHSGASYSDDSCEC